MTSILTDSEIRAAISDCFKLDVRSHQLDAIKSYVSGCDTLFVAPTGYGKSLVFQVAPELFKRQRELATPPAVSPSLTSTAICDRVIILSPLISLMKDSVARLNKDISEPVAVHLVKETVEVARGAVYVFASPEALLDGKASHELLKESEFSSTVRAVFVDECHLISAYAPSSTGEPPFRSAYTRLAQLRSFFPVIPFVALTATATRKTIADVVSALDMVNPRLIRVGVDKPNIVYHVTSPPLGVQSELRFRWLVDAVQELPSFRMLIFFRSLITAGDIYDYVTFNLGQSPDDKVKSIYMYNRTTVDDNKDEVLEEMTGSDTERSKVILCSASFSLGVNLKGIDYVVHYGSPGKIEEFIQETGRAAREPDHTGHSLLITEPRLHAGRVVEQAMKDFASTTTCRREVLLNVFGESVSTGPIGCCDNCDWEQTAIPLMSIVDRYLDAASLVPPSPSLSDTVSTATLFGSDTGSDFY